MLDASDAADEIRANRVRANYMHHICIESMSRRHSDYTMRHMLSLGVKHCTCYLTGILMLRIYPQYSIVYLGIRVPETIEECRW